MRVDEKTYEKYADSLFTASTFGMSLEEVKHCQAIVKMGWWLEKYFYEYTDVVCHFCTASEPNCSECEVTKVAVELGKYPPKKEAKND